MDNTTNINNLKEEKISLSVVVRDLKAMVAVPGTNTMLSFVLFYKLAERGENLIPLFLVDKQVPVASLGFWTGAVRSCASLAGSALAGYLISVRGTSPHLLLKWSAWVRCLPVLSQLLVVSLWPQEDFPPLLYAAAIITLSVSAFVAGVLTTACFTTMMQLSRLRHWLTQICQTNCSIKSGQQETTCRLHIILCSQPWK